MQTSENKNDSNCNINENQSHRKHGQNKKPRKGIVW